MLISTNITPRNKTSKIAQVVLKNMKEAICRSLGPYGAPTIVAVDDADILMTKDGYHIIRMAAYNEPISNTFAKIIKDLSKELVTSVGDGSTTCVVVAYHFFMLLQKEMETGLLKGCRQKEIMDTVNLVVSEVIEEIKKLARPVSDDLSEIKALASVSLNNNEEMGEMIANIYKKIGTEGYINVQLGNSTNTYTDETDGFMINFGRMDEIFVNNDYNESELHNSAVLIFNSALNSDTHERFIRETINLINNNIYLKNSAANNGIKSYPYESLTIICPGLGVGVVNMLKSFINQYKNKGARINFNIIQYSTSTEFDRTFLYDIAIMCGATVITETENEEGKMQVSFERTNLNQDDAKDTIGNYVGFAGKIVSGKRTTTFYDATESKNEIAIEKNKILTELKELNNDSGQFVRIYELRKRLATISKKLVTIYVGGYNEANRKSDKELIDDAVNACKSAIKNGYVIGGNLIIHQALENILNREETSDIFKAVAGVVDEAFRLVLKDVFGNKYDLENPKDSDLVDSIIDICRTENKMYDLIGQTYTDTDIINPADTDIEILKHATSIISLILTSNQFISRNTNHLIADIEDDSDILED